MKRIFVLFLGLTTFGLIPALAQAEGLNFTQTQFNYELKVGQELRIDLRTLLKDNPSTNLTWSHGPNKPSWITIDSEKSLLFGTPSAGVTGDHSFRISVKSGELGAIAQMNISILSLPEWSASPLDLGLQKEGTPYELDLNTKITDPTGGTLVFNASGLPNWMKLSQSGILSGTPRRADVGKYSGIEFTATGTGGSATVRAFGEVLKTIQPPSWQMNPINLPNAFEDKNYSQNIAKFVTHPEATPISFKLVSAPNWVSINSAGTIFGTPGASDVGQTSLLVRYSTNIDGQQFESTTEVKFEVIHTNHPPKWSGNPLTLPEAFTGVIYSQDLSGSAADPDPQDTLQFRKVSGPSWANISSNGNLTGTPPKSNVGLNTWVVAVSDGEFEVETNVNVTVNKSNEPPVWIQNPVVLSNAQEDFSYNADLTQFVKDPDNDRLTFTLLEGPMWVQISSQGSFFGTPGANDIGLNKFRVRVTDGISGNAVAEILINVDATNHRPTWVLNPIFFTVDAESKVNVSIAPYAQDSDAGDTLQFQKLSGPDWANLSNNGSFTGTPQMADVGTNRFNVRVIDQGGLSADAVVQVTVLAINHPPLWTQNPIVLPNAPERSLYSQDISQFAQDTDPQESLSFLKVSGPGWAQISPQGVISGTPQRGDLGLNTFQVRVLDKENETAVTSVEINVIKVNIPPRWRQSPVALDDAFEDKNYQFNLERYAVDDDQDPLSFSKISGPEWLQVSPDGTISGVPGKDDVGDYTAVLGVTDGVATVEANAVGKVIHTNHAPTFAATYFAFEVKERSTLEVNLNSAEYVSDPDGDQLFFNLVNGKPWIKLSAEGKLVATPLHSELGSHEFTVRVHDNDLYAESKITITVVRDAQMPVWSQNPIRMTARTNEAFSGDVAPFASDLDGVALRFSKTDGPAWLNVGADGRISGTPIDTDMGENSFTLTATNDALSSDVILLISVIPGTQIDTVQVDATTENAVVENVWVVDSSKWSYYLMDELRKNVHYYASTLEKKNVKHTGVLLHPDFDVWKAEPISGEGVLLESSNNSWSSDFYLRTKSSYSLNCVNTPIWTLTNFYHKVKTQGLEGFMKQGIPSDVMIVTKQRDHYPHYTQGTAYAGFKARDFARDFNTRHKNLDKPFRISAIAPHCPTLSKNSEGSVQAGSANSYEILVNETGGKFYNTDCGINMASVMREYAESVGFRAIVSANKVVPLSMNPIETNTITVRIGSRVLEGNTGSNTDEWRYDGANNRILLYWDQIGIDSVKPGEQIIIEYRVS